MIGIAIIWIIEAKLMLSGVLSQGIDHLVLSYPSSCKEKNTQ